MPGIWHYSRGAGTHGPFTAEQMMTLIAQKTLRENDLVWRADIGEKGAVLAREAFEFEEKATTGGSLPDWLADVEFGSAEPPPRLISEPQPQHGKPEWLEDLRLWVGLEIYSRAKEPAPAPAGMTKLAPGMTVLIPDW